MRALLLHHDPNSLPGLIGEALEERGVEAVAHQVCRTPGSPTGSPDFPDPTPFDLVWVHGSLCPLADPDTSHWALPELGLLRRADGSSGPGLGRCCGCPLRGAAPAAPVRPAPEPEVGWFEVHPTSPEIEVGPWLQWHFDVFEVPAGAELLASSPVGPQAFRLRRNLALQFHPEADRGVIEAWFDDDIDQIAELGLDPTELLVEADRQRPAARDRAGRLVDLLLSWT